MAKKPKEQALTVSDAKTDDVVGFVVTDAARAFAQRLGVDINASVEERADRAADHMSRSQLHMLGAGLLLSSIKAEAEHGEFTRIVTERGFEERAAQRAMTYAQFVLSRPEGERDLLLDMPRYKVLTLAQADPEVVDQLLADGGGELSALSVKAMAARIKALEAQGADMAVRLETSQNETKAAVKAAQRALKDHTSDIPLPVFDVRQEVVALLEKVGLCLGGMQSACTELTAHNDLEHLQDWVDPTARLALAGLVSMKLQINGLISNYVAAFGLEDIQPAPMSFLKPEEVELMARKWPELTARHGWESAMRDWQRKQDRPRGKGRPEARPEAPKTTVI